MKKLIVIFMVFSSALCFSQGGLPATPGQFVQGLNYEYFYGKWNSTSYSEFEKGRTANFSLGKLIAVDEYSLTKFTGFINVPKDAAYTFYIKSNNGATLTIDGVGVVFNDSLHSLKEKYGTITLAKGMHSVELPYFQQYKDVSAIVSWKIGTTKSLIPDSVLFTRAVADTMPDVYIKGFVLLANPADLNSVLIQVKGYKLIKEDTYGELKTTYLDENKQVFPSDKLVWFFSSYQWQ